MRAAALSPEHSKFLLKLDHHGTWLEVKGGGAIKSVVQSDVTRISTLMQGLFAPADPCTSRWWWWWLLQPETTGTALTRKPQLVSTPTASPTSRLEPLPSPHQAAQCEMR